MKTGKKFKKTFYSPAEMMFSYVKNKESDPLLLYPHDQVKRAGGKKEEDNTLDFDMDDWGDDDDFGFDDEDEEDEKESDKSESKEDKKSKKAAKDAEKAKKKKDDFGDSWGMDWDDDEEEDYGGDEFFIQKGSMSLGDKKRAMSLNRYKSIYHKERQASKNESQDSKSVKVDSKPVKDTKPVQVINSKPAQKRVEPPKQKAEPIKLKTSVNITNEEFEHILKVEKSKNIKDVAHVVDPKANMTFMDALKKADEAIKQHKAEKKVEHKMSMPKAVEKQVLKSTPQAKEEMKKHVSADPLNKSKSSFEKHLDKIGAKTVIKTTPVVKTPAPVKNEKAAASKPMPVVNSNGKPTQVIKKAEVKQLIKNDKRNNVAKAPAKQSSTANSSKPLIAPQSVKKASAKASGQIIKKSGEVHLKNINQTVSSKKEEHTSGKIAVKPAAQSAHVISTPKSQ